MFEHALPSQCSRLQSSRPSWMVASPSISPPIKLQGEPFHCAGKNRNGCLVSTSGNGQRTTKVLEGEGNDAPTIPVGHQDERVRRAAPCGTSARPLIHQAAARRSPPGPGRKYPVLRNSVPCYPKPSSLFRQIQFPVPKEQGNRPQAIDPTANMTAEITASSTTGPEFLPVPC